MIKRITDLGDESVVMAPQQVREAIRSGGMWLDSSRPLVLRILRQHPILHALRFLRRSSQVSENSQLHLLHHIMKELPPSPLVMSPGSVLLQEFERKTSSKIALPDSAKSKREWGHKEYIVIAVGPERILDNGQAKPMPFKKGQKAMPIFNQGIAFDIKGRNYLAIPQEGIIGVEDEAVMTLLESEDMRKLVISTEGPHQ